MQKMMLLGVLALGMSWHAVGDPGIASDAVSKVVTLLDTMKLKAEDDMHAEDVQYSTYSTWANATLTMKTIELGKENAEIKSLNAQIKSLNSQMAKLNQDINTQQQAILRYNGELSAATQAREDSHTEFNAHWKDYNETIDALAGATATLSARAHDSAQAGSLLQISALIEAQALEDPSLFSEESKSAFRELLATQAPSFLQVKDAPAVKGYENHMEPILEMFGNLTNKFTQERIDLVAAETQKQHDFEMLASELNNQITTATATKDSLTGNLNTATANLGDAQKTLVDTTAERDATSAYIQDLSTTFSIKGSDFKSRRKLRVDEIEGMRKALEILNSDDVTGSAGRNTAMLFQERAERRHRVFQSLKPTSLAQLRGAKKVPLQLRLAEFLQQQGQSIGSRVLMALAAHAGDDPLAQVKTMITDVIAQLQSEHRSEDDHSGWCRGELMTNENNRIQKSNNVDALHAELDKLNADVTQLAQSISEQAQEISTLQVSLAQATELRAKEKGENANSLKDATNGEIALQKAIAIITQFYDKAAKEPPPIFDATYQGNQAGAQGAGGIIATLEGLMADFSKLGADTRQEEQTAVTEFRQFSKDTNVQLATLQAGKHDSESERSTKTELIATRTNDLKAADNDLLAATEYYNQLNKSCVNDQIDKQKKRNDEIDSLQKALQFLNETDDLFADVTTAAPAF